MDATSFTFKGFTTGHRKIFTRFQKLNKRKKTHTHNKYKIIFDSFKVHSFYKFFGCLYP